MLIGLVLENQVWQLEHTTVTTSGPTKVTTSHNIVHSNVNNYSSLLFALHRKRFSYNILPLKILRNDSKSTEYNSCKTISCNHFLMYLLYTELLITFRNTCILFLTLFCLNNYTHSVQPLLKAYCFMFQM